MTRRSERRRELEAAIDHKIAEIHMWLQPSYWPMPYYFRNKIKMRAKGLARCAFELRPDLREQPK